MKKSFLLSGIIVLNICGTIAAAESNRPATYRMIDVVLADTPRVNWNAVFAILDTMKGTISVNEYSNKKGMSLLHIAVIKRSLLAAKELLEKYKANPNLQDSFGNTPLIFASSEKGDVPMVKLLLKYGADPYLQSRYGQNSFRVTLNPAIETLLKNYPYQQ
jgi:hypothetical protein